MLLCLSLVLLLALTGCARFLPGRASKPAPAPEAPAPPPEPVVQAADLFPAADAHVVYSLTDQGKAPVTVEEDWVRDGDRLLMAAGGVTYAVWYIRSDGVWRADPKGSGRLLRYLPATLKAGLAWRHQVAGREVFFRLSEAAGSCQEAGPCWKLEVANAGEATTFIFAGNRGPVRAEAINQTRPADSFVKSVTRTGPAQLLAEHRKALLDKAGAAPEAAPLVDATWDAVQKALAGTGG
jgi:hypothetical protein